MKKIIVITGASSGIGNNLYKLYEKDNIVINLSRTQSKDLNTIICDVSVETDVINAFSIIKEKYNRVDLLINNAGYGISGATELIKSEDAHKMFDTNFFGVLYSSKHCLPLMKENSMIVNISSATALFPLPYRALYCASKASVSMLSKSMAMELSQAKIKIVSICPGDTKTNFTKNRQKNFETNERYAENIKNATEKLDKREDKRMSVNYVANKIYKISNKKNPKPEYIIGFKYKAFAFVKRILPERWFNKILQKMFSK